MNKLDEKIKAYFEHKREVIAVYLFGSYADGNNRDFFKGRRDDYIVELSRILRKDIDAVILNSAGEELLRQMFLKGKCILVKDSRKLARYKAVMLAKIAEFGYYRSRMQSGLITKIMEG